MSEKEEKEVVKSFSWSSFLEGAVPQLSLYVLHLLIVPSTQAFREELATCCLLRYIWLHPLAFSVLFVILRVNTLRKLHRWMDSF